MGVWVRVPPRVPIEKHRENRLHTKGKQMQVDKKAFLNFLDAYAEEVLARQSRDGSFGRFKAINDQYPFYTLAVLYKNPSSAYFQNSDVKKTIVSSLRNRLKSMDSKGRLIFFSATGENLGYVYSDWSHFNILETIFYLASEIPAKLRTDLKRKLLIALDEHLKEANKRLRDLKKTASKSTHNLLVWKTLLLYRAGILFSNEKWMSFAEEAMRFFIGNQHKEGWWSEGGPITTYNYVTVLAVSLYHEWSGDKSALKSMERALCYHLSTTYPDMRNIETIDGRVRYHGIGPYLPPSFARFAEGARFLNELLEAMRKRMDGGRIQQFSFLGVCFNHLPEEPRSSKIVERKEHLTDAKFACVRRSGWCVTACGYENEWVNSRFRLDRQNLLSVWHEKTGLIIGGGHSKFQPEFSLFNVFDASDTVKYLHDKATMKSRRDGIDLKLWYGDVKVGVAIRIVNPAKLSLSFSCNVPNGRFGKQLIRHRLIFLPKLGEKLVGASAETVLEKEFVDWTTEDHGGRLSHNGWILTIPDLEHIQTNARWPVHPFNTYRLDAKSDPENAALIVSSDFHICHKTVEYTLEV